MGAPKRIWIDELDDYGRQSWPYYIGEPCMYGPYIKYTRSDIFQDFIHDAKLLLDTMISYDGPGNPEIVDAREAWAFIRKVVEFGKEA